MVDHFSHLTHVHLIRSTIQQQILSGKVSFERWASTFGVKIKRYHSDNERFAEQTFRLAIEDFNQTITFCGVLYNHQNAIAERKIQALTLGDREFILHAKRYFPEAITTMLWTYALKAFEEQLNVLKVDYDGITPMQNF